MMATHTNNRAQIERVYREFKDPVYNYAYRLSGDSDQAQDVTQHTFLKIITDPGFNEVENIKSYLFTIARNHLYDTWKKKKESLADDTGIDIVASAGEGELTEELAEQQRQQAVIFCVQRLAEKYREVMILRYIEDLSVKEIASVTQRSLSDIKVTLLRARQRFDHELTQHMYLKVAKSRQQCGEMKSMLAPYSNIEIPSDKLPLFESHIDNCSICSEDAEELKRKRKLLAIIPLATAPLSLDTSFNDAMAASISPSTPVPDASTAGNAVLIKVVITVAIGALIVGGIMLLLEKKPVSVPEDPPNVAQPSPPPLQPPLQAPTPQAPTQSPLSKQTAATGSVAVTAKVSLASGEPPTHTLWGVYKLSPDKNKQEKDVGGALAATLNKKLDPGKYRITVQIDQLKQERIIEVVAGKPLSLNFDFNAVEVHVSTQLARTITLYDSQLAYLIYKTREDANTTKHIEIKSFSEPATTFRLPPGDYYLKAQYAGFGYIGADKNFTVKEGQSLDIDIPVEIGMFKPEAFLSSKKLSHIRNYYWRIKESSVPQNLLNTGFRSISNGVETPMMPGTYTLETKLEHITQQSEVTIKAGQVTTHKIILKGGIAKFAGWLDKLKTRRNDDIYFYLYDYDAYKSVSNKNDFIPRLVNLNNDLNNSQILPEGKYTIEARNKLGHKIRLTHDFTVEDGDNKQIDLEVQK